MSPNSSNDQYVCIQITISLKILKSTIHKNHFAKILILNHTYTREVSSFHRNTQQTMFCNRENEKEKKKAKTKKDTNHTITEEQNEDIRGFSRGNSRNTKNRRRMVKMKRTRNPGSPGERKKTTIVTTTMIHESELVMLKD